jgi:hypothetical protein
MTFCAAALGTLFLRFAETSAAQVSGRWRVGSRGDEEGSGDEVGVDASPADDMEVGARGWARRGGSLLAYGLLTCTSQQGALGALSGRVDQGKVGSGSRTHRLEVLQHHLDTPLARC